VAHPPTLAAMGTPTADAPLVRPRLRIAAVLSAVLAACLLAYGVFVLADWISGNDADHASAAALIVVMCLGWSAGLVAVARGMLRGARWARTPLFVSGLLLATAGWSAGHGDGAAPVLGWVLFAVSLVAAVASVAATPDLEG
jgi:Na+-driven multidrug efflux pump